MSTSKTSKSKKMKIPKHLQHINPYAAGIDIGSRSHFVAVPEGLSEQPVQEFSTFTDDLHRMVDWITACGVTTVAMESTGIYWIPVFEILESRGLDFDDAPLLFASSRRITWPDSRQDYGEAREITMGELAGRLVIMVHTKRGDATRIISMRKANEREQRWFEKQFEEG